MKFILILTILFQMKGTNPHKPVKGARYGVTIDQPLHFTAGFPLSNLTVSSCPVN